MQQPKWEDVEELQTVFELPLCIPRRMELVSDLTEIVYIGDKIVLSSPGVTRVVSAESFLTEGDITAVVSLPGEMPDGLDLGIELNPGAVSVPAIKSAISHIKEDKLYANTNGQYVANYLYKAPNVTKHDPELLPAAVSADLAKYIDYVGKSFAHRYVSPFTKFRAILQIYCGMTKAEAFRPYFRGDIHWKGYPELPGSEVSLVAKYADMPARLIPMRGPAREVIEEIWKLGGYTVSPDTVIPKPMLDYDMFVNDFIAWEDRALYPDRDYLADLAGMRWHATMYPVPSKLSYSKAELEKIQAPYYVDDETRCIYVKEPGGTYSLCHETELAP